MTAIIMTNKPPTNNKNIGIPLFLVFESVYSIAQDILTDKRRKREYGIKKTD